MSKVVRSSKFRHVFGTPSKPENCFDGIRPANQAWENTDFVTCSPSVIAFPWEAAGGGSVCAIPWSAHGKYDPKKSTIIAGHKAQVLDLDFSPFNDYLLATASEDGSVKLWTLDPFVENMTECAQNLVGHKRKVGTCKFNPVANNILLTSSTDFAVKIWDVEKGEVAYSIDGSHPEIINSCVWKEDGSLFATICKDKKLRVIDPRQTRVVQEVLANTGAKSRCLWLKDKLISIGFPSGTEREMKLWDPVNMLEGPLAKISLESGSGIFMPYFDSDTNMLYLAGKGEGTTRYFELVNEAPHLYHLADNKLATPQKGVGWLPKRGVNVSDCEVARMLRLLDKKIEPISFTVPRKSEIFQDDLFPDCFSGEYTMTATEWRSGQEGVQKRRSMAPGFVQKPRQADAKFDKKEEAKPLSEKELHDELEKSRNRVAYLEAELVRRDAKIRELESRN